MRGVDEDLLVQELTIRLAARLAEAGRDVPLIVVRAIARNLVEGVKEHMNALRRLRKPPTSPVLRFIKYMRNSRKELVAEFIGDGLFQKGRTFTYTRDRVEEAVSRIINPEHRAVMVNVLENWPEPQVLRPVVPDLPPVLVEPEPVPEPEPTPDPVPPPDEVPVAPDHLDRDSLKRKLQDVG